MNTPLEFDAVLRRLPAEMRSREALERTYDGVYIAELRRAGLRGRLARVAPAAAISGSVAIATYDAAISLVAGVIAAVAGLWTFWSLRNGVKLARHRLRPATISSPLEAVRASRPHAIDADPAIVHVEYAVDVDDRGDLALWQFLPVPYGVTAEELPAGCQLVGGRPNYVASKLRRIEIDRHSTANSAAAIVDWQERAAAMEREAILTARRDADAVDPADQLDFVSAELLRSLIPGRRAS